MEEAGFEIEAIFGKRGLVLIRKGDVDLDILCDADSPMDIVSIEGQNELAVQGYRHVDMLLDASISVTVGPDFHASFDPPVTLRIPTLPAYALGKVLSARGRTVSRRRVKDLVYVYEVLRQPGSRTALIERLPGHAESYPVPTRAAAEALSEVLAQKTVLRNAAEQLRESGRMAGKEDALASLRTHLRRLGDELTRIIE